MATDGTDVSPDSVSDFGKKSLDEMKVLSEGAGTVMGAIGSASRGGSGLAESVSFAKGHANESQVLGMFVRDASRGLLALGFGAITIADNYRHADRSQAQQMRGVDAAFNPGHGTPSLASEQAKADKAAAAARKHAPKIQPKALPRPDATAPEATDHCPVTPEEQVAAHTDLYGEHETWRPGS